MGLGRYHQGIKTPTKITRTTFSLKSSLRAYLRPCWSEGYEWDGTDTNQLLSKGILEEPNFDQDKQTIRLPEIKIQTNFGIILALLDTAAEITCISENIFDQILATKQFISVLPITTERLRGAFGQKCY